MIDGKKGYLLPAVIDPGAVRCVKVYIPDDLFYYAAFWSAFQFFGTWLAWERDDAHRGTQAAAVWRVAYEQSREEWLAGGGCQIMLEDVRQNEDDPCQLEKTFDGEEWVPFADLQLCPPRIQLPSEPGGPILWWNPECNAGAGCWEPIPTPEGEEIYDPAYDDPQTPIDPDFVDAGTDPECAYAANVVEALKSIYERVDYGLLTGTLATIVWIEAYLQILVGRWFPKKLKEILGAIAQASLFTYTEWHDDYQNFDWDVLVNVIACAFGEDGTVTEVDFSIMMAKIDQHDTPVWILTKAIMLAVGPVGLNNAADFAGITEYVCNPDCELTLNTCWDLRSDDFDFEVLSGHGTWVGYPGWGWQGTLDGGSYVVDIEHEDVPVGIIDTLRVDFSFSGGGKVFRVYINGTLWHEQLGGNAGARTAQFPVGEVINTLRIYASQNTLNNLVAIKQVCFYRE